MAEAKVKAIKDERILKEVKEIQGENAAQKEWTPDHQAKLIWNLFRTNPAMKYAKMEKEEIKKAYAQWQADWSNGRLAYPSNTARSLAACEPPLARGDIAQEFSTDDIK